MSTMTAGDVAGWHSERFAACDLHVCMSGDVSIESAAGLLEQALGSLPGPPHESRTVRAPDIPRGRVEERLVSRGQSSVAVGFGAPAMGTRESAAMHVLANALTMMGGRLWSALRERPPHAYSVRATPVSLREGGALVCYVTTGPGEEERAVSTLLSQLSAVSREGLAEDELARGRRHLAGMIEISMQRGATRAASYALAEVAGVGYEHIDRLPSIIRDITGDDVTRVARRYVTAEDGPAVAILRG